MDKTKQCNTCYWKENNTDSNRHCGFQDEIPITKYCEEYNRKCEHCSWEFQGKQRYNNIAEFKYKNDYYCENCMSDKLGIEKRECTTYDYYDVHGNYLGNSNDINLENILLDCSFVEFVGE